MVGRNIKGFFLGVPIPSEGSFTEDDRLRRDGVGYACLSLMSYGANDLVISYILMALCLLAAIHLNLASRSSFHFRVMLSISSSITYLVAILRSDVAGLAPAVVMAALAYYGLMYFTGFDR